MDWANALLKEPFVVKDGQVCIPDVPGAGITWNEEAVRKYLAP
jgi:mandelate racemase